LGGLAAALLSSVLVVSFPATAEVVRLRTTGYAEMGSGEADCYQTAARNGTGQAVVDVLKNIGTGIAESQLRGILEDSEDAVRGVKILSEKVMGDGRCRVKVRVKVDTTVLKNLIAGTVADSMNEQQFSVGVVVRFSVNGKVSNAGEVGTQSVLAKMAEEFRARGAEVVSLDPLMDNYVSLKSANDWEAYVEDEAEEQRSDGTKITESQAIAELIEAIHEVWSAFPEGLRRFDAIAIAQVYVSSRGRDPQGPGFVSDVTTHIRLLQVDGDAGPRTELASGIIPGTIDASTQDRANLEAMLLSVESSVDVVTRTLTR
jgi:hypothetical protein